MVDPEDVSNIPLWNVAITSWNRAYPKRLGSGTTKFVFRFFLIAYN